MAGIFAFKTIKKDRREVRVMILSRHCFFALCSALVVLVVGVAVLHRRDVARARLEGMAEYAVALATANNSTNLMVGVLSTNEVVRTDYFDGAHVVRVSGEEAWLPLSGTNSVSPGDQVKLVSLGNRLVAVPWWATNSWP